MSEEDLRFGSVSISEDAHEFLANLVENEEGFLEDSPFTAIVEAFRFAFALGYSSNLREKKGGKARELKLPSLIVSFSLTYCPYYFLVYFHFLTDVSETGKHFFI